MSQSIVVICPSGITRETVHRTLSQEWNCFAFNPTPFVKEVQIREETAGGISYLSVNEMLPADAAREDYGTNDELNEAFRKGISNKSFYLVTFNDVGLARRALGRLLSETAKETNDIGIDNGYGVVIRADVVLARLAQDPAWDWRIHAPGGKAGE